MSRADPRPGAPDRPPGRPRLRPRNGRKKSRAALIVVISIGIAAVLLLGGTFLFAPDRVYDPGESFGTERPAHIPPPEGEGKAP